MISYIWTYIKEKLFLYRSLSESSVRYPLSILHIFKGEQAFHFHSEMVSLKEEFLERVSDSEKKSSFMVIKLQETISNEILSGKKSQPVISRKRILIDFYIDGSDTIRSGSAYNSANGEKWRKIMNDNIIHDISKYYV